MQPSPLQLDKSVIESIRLDTVPNHDPNKKTNYEVTSNIGLQQAQDDPSHWVIRLGITVKEKEGEEPPPYHVDVKIVGFFTSRLKDNETPAAAKLIAVNGVSMLYSSLREYLLLVSSRGLWPPIMLPTVSFAELEIGEPHGKTSEEKPPAKKPVKRTTRRTKSPAKEAPARSTRKAK